MTESLVRRGSIRPEAGPFYQDVVAGLSQRPRAIPCKWLWDARGSQIFERICDTPEYYLTRAEREIFALHVREIADAIGPSATLIELGPGNGQKTRAILDRLESPERYVAVDLDATMLDRLAGELALEHAELAVDTVCADFTREVLRVPRGAGRGVILCAGSTIGNFHPHEAVALLSRCALAVGKGGLVLVGVDLKKSKSVIEAAYDDKRGLTAALNRNLLVRINREIGATFDVTRFAHRAPYDPIRGRVEMRLVSESDQEIVIDGRTFPISRGEWIVTEHCYKYDLAEFRQVARRAGLWPMRAWTDPGKRVSLHELRVS